MECAGINQLVRKEDVVLDAFPSRQALMPIWGNSIQDENQWQSIWQDIVTTPLTDNMLAYVHIPFCANHCSFCGFYRNRWQESHGQPYVDRVIAELQSEVSQRPQGGSIQAVYLGGGTPTALSAHDLHRLVTALRQYLPLSPDCEITVEGRMSHFDKDKVDACIAAGANRFSFGVQTFNTKLRRRLGRKHTGEAAAEYLSTLCARKEAVIVLDLIFGLPGQTDDIWQNDLDTALQLGLDGLDVYAFNSYPMLPIHRQIEKGILPAVPGLEVLAVQYAYACQRILTQGFKQISNSHFASTQGRERNIYNSQIKSGRDCLAFGSGAGGCHAGYSYSGLGDLAQYLAVPVDKKPLGRLAQLDKNRQWFGQIQGALEQGLLDLSLLAGNEASLQLVSEFQHKGLLHVNNQQAELTIAGRFWGPTITRALLQPLTQSTQ